MEKTGQLIIVLATIISAIILIEFLPPKEGTFVENKAVEAGKTPPLFALESHNGGIVSLESYRGRPILINFWASWCEPCLEEMPLFERTTKENKELVIIGINLQESRGAAKAFAEELDITFPLVLDPDGKAKRAYGLFSQPVTFFISRDFVVKDRKNGPLTPEELEEKLRTVL